MAPTLNWNPYTPPAGSYVELFPDGSFRLEGHDDTFTQSEEADVNNSILVAFKAAGQGNPLSVQLFRGTKPVRVLLCYGDLDGTGVEQWHRNSPNQAASAPNTPSAPSKNTVNAQARALPRLTVDDNWFRVGFFVFVLWYLFMHHQVFRGIDAVERYPATVPKSSTDDYLPPKHTF